MFVHLYLSTKTILAKGLDMLMYNSKFHRKFQGKCKGRHAKTNKQTSKVTTAGGYSLTL